MATMNDHRAFREQNDTLTALHDEWMHSSTGTSSEPQGNYDTSINASGPPDLGKMVLPPSDSFLHVGYPPTDVLAIVTKGQRSWQEDNTPNPPVSPNANPESRSNPDADGNTNPDSKSHHHEHERRRRWWHRRGRRSGGGGGVTAAGPGQLGNAPQLGNVPMSSQSQGGGSPLVVLFTLGVLAIVIYFVWHKFRKSRSEDKDLEKKGR